MQLKEINNKYTVTNVRYGRPKVECLSIELDSTTIVLSNISSINIEADDIVELTNENNEKEYWLVGAVSKNYTTFKSPYLFEYQIDLMSLTKILETIFLPNMTITDIGQNRKISFYIGKIISTYFKTTYDSYTTFDYSQLFSDTNSVNVKEFVFREPTLREYLDSLLNLLGGIVKLEMEYTNGTYQFVFSLVKLSGNATALPTTYIKEITSQFDSDDYVSEIVHTTDDIVATQYITEYVRESTDEPLLTTKNAQIQLSRKVYDFKKLIIKNVSYKIYHYDYLQGGGNTEDRSELSSEFTMDVDISKYILNSEEYNTLSYPSSNDYTAVGKTRNNFYTNTPNKYLTNCMMWDRSDNSIKYLYESKQYKSKPFSESNTGTAIENAVRHAIADTLIARGYLPYVGYEPDQYYLITYPGTLTETQYWEIRLETDIPDNFGFNEFIVTYQPYFSPKLSEIANRRHLISSIDTASNSKTDILTSLDSSKEKLNQLGCDYKLFTGLQAITSYSGSRYPYIKVGQYWLDENNNKYIVTKLETTINMDFIQFKGTLNRNFSNSIINTQLNREKRYFAYASDDVVVRKEQIKKMWKLSIGNTEESTAVVPADYIAIIFADGTIYDSGDNLDMNVIGEYLIPIIPIYNDRMIAYELETIDNISVAHGHEDTNSSGYKTTIYKYVNDDGEFTNFKYKIGRLNAESTEPIYGAEILTPVEFARKVDISGCKSLLTMRRLYSQLFNGNTIDDTYSILKDNREQLSVTFQYILKCEDNIQFYIDKLMNCDTSNCKFKINNTVYPTQYTYDDIFTLDFAIIFMAYNPNVTISSGNLVNLEILIYNNESSSYETLCKVLGYDGGYLQSNITNYSGGNE